jgi:purine-binding chemotaxis protein CheW
MAKKSSEITSLLESQGRSREGKYLTFRLGEEEFGIGILKVKEIIGMMAFTPIPRTPEFVKGVINLRGKVIPVLDLRLKFSLEPIPYDERTCIVVVQAQGETISTSIGLVVDAVNEVANIKGEDIENTPCFGVRLDTAYILGMAKSGENVRILLDIDRVLGTEELSLLNQAA